LAINFGNPITVDPNVIVTGHQAFFTEEALLEISKTTLSNISCIEQSHPCSNEVKASKRAEKS
jgi:D-lactate dehydrogenase